MPYSDRPYQTFGPAPEWPAGLTWHNTTDLLTLHDLRGRAVLLVFWAQSNLNCIHVIDDLAPVIDRFADRLTVIGIHTPKFDGERSDAVLRAAMDRNGIRFPVVNDKDHAIWKAYGASAWPTICLLDPQGRVAAAFAGEGHINELGEAVTNILDFQDAEGPAISPPPAFIPAAYTPQLLQSPSKLMIDPDSRLLYIADSAAHHITVTDLDGVVNIIIGSGNPGHVDGSFDSAAFNRPMGMAIREGILYIADSGNHAIRKINLADRTVGTFGGGGIRGNVYTMTGGAGTLMCSPHDVIMVDNMLYIAMTGSHQIWRAAAETANFRPFIGTGLRGLADGPGPSAHLAQPTGLAHGRGWLYFVDSESSALRRSNLSQDGEVETLIGHGLFAFGDASGNSAKAQLQRPLGIDYHDGAVYIADSYNSKIKVVYPATGQVDEFAMPNQAMGEPHDVAYFEGRVYIADARGGRVLVMDPEQATVTELPLR